MKKQLTSLDLFYLVRELQSLVTGRVQKIYQIEDKVYLAVYSESKKQMLVIAPGYMTVSEYIQEFPQKPPNFCMLLRKHLLGKRIMGIHQRGFERIIEIEFADRLLIVELFADGNIILVDKENNEIIQPMHSQVWKDRTVKSRVAYKLPPAGANPYQLLKNEFTRALHESDKDLVRTLATKFGLGGHYAEEIIFRCGLGKEIQCGTITEQMLNRIYERTKEIFEQKLAPCIYSSENIIAPFELQKINHQPQRFETFSQAIDEFFKQTVVISGQHDELERRLGEQRKSLVDLETAIEKHTIAGHAFSTEQKFKEAKVEYDKVKKARGKTGGLVEAINRTKSELGKTEIIVKEPKKREETHKEWFEKFRWFKSSDGFLIVAGKDATTNDIIVKKHADKGDAVFHAEIVGAPFCVVKANGAEIPATTLEETAQFAASYSKAWQKNFGAVNVMWVWPEQLSKEGALAKGAWAVHGERHHFHKVLLELGFAIADEGGLAHGPAKMIEKIAKNFVIIQPGDDKSAELAKEIKRTIGYNGETEDIQRLIPSGKGRIK